MGTNTMQMHRVETSAGTAICCAPSRMARTVSLPMRQIPIDVFDLYGGVVHQNTDGQRQASQGHDVDGFVERAQHDDRNQAVKVGWKRQ
jgi:hypothetical protein